MGTIFKAQDITAQQTVRAFNEMRMPEWPILHSSELRNEFRDDLAEYRVDVEHVDAVPMGEIEELRALLESAQKQLVETEQSAYQRGLEEGKSLATSREQDRFELLKANAQKAQSQLDEHLAGLQVLSLQLAQIALSKIFGNAEQFSELIAASIRHRCNHLSSELITGIRVSSEDFQSQEALAALMQASGRTDIVGDAKLVNGDCRIDLKLGQYDIGIGSQWQKLQAFLIDLSLEEMPA